jgi:hypothetical protein
MQTTIAIYSQYSFQDNVQSSLWYASRVTAQVFLSQSTLWHQAFPFKGGKANKKLQEEVGTKRLRIARMKSLQDRILI